MGCAWDEFIKLIPQWMRPYMDKQRKNDLLELRMRIGVMPELVTSKGSVWLQQAISRDDLLFSINAASRYSPWSAATMADGYITAPGGHRVGICGTATVSAGTMTGISFPSSICLRVAREFCGVAQGLDTIGGSILIIGKPGWGKSTLLRDLIRLKSDREEGAICVVDEKGELFPCSGGSPCFDAGKRTDIITGCSKPEGIEAVLRNMCPKCIAVDEITAEADSLALIRAGWCGVALLATAHAGDMRDFLSRPIYRKLAETKLFSTLVVLDANRSWKLERINI